MLETTRFSIKKAKSRGEIFPLLSVYTIFVTVIIKIMNYTKQNIQRTIPFVILFFSLLTCFSCKKTQHANDEDINVQWVDTARHIYAFGINIDTFNVNENTLERGDSPATIFADLGFSPQMTDSIKNVTKDILDPRKLQAGMKYYTFETTGDDPEIRFIAFAKSVTDFAVIDFTRDTLYAYEYSKFINLHRNYAEGTISSTLWDVINESGADPLLAIKLSEVFAWQIDFFDIKEGDSFQVIYNQACIDDTTELDISSIEGAIFNHDGKRYVAIPFMQNGEQVFYDENGQALRKAFLKAPLDYFRITSRFTNARFHPILKIYRPHHGVDYAAPKGTPIKSIGDGTITFKGWMNGGGNSLRIRHSGSYETSYMHMSRYAKGIRKGSHMSQGQIIGYVGATGLATGPHLDFRVYKNGTAINPLHIQAPPSTPISRAELDSFKITKNRVLKEFETLHRDYLKNHK